MRSKHLLALGLFLLAACHKNSPANPPVVPARLAPSPAASFTTNADTVTNKDIITLATYDQFEVFSTSTNAESVLWDFGDGSSASITQYTNWYTKAGTYTLNLTVKNKDGVKSTVSRQVKVNDRIMKQFQITGLKPLFWPVGHSLDHANVWGVIRLGPNGMNYPTPSGVNTSFPAPVIYQTQVITGLDSAKLPYKFDIPAKMIVDFPTMAIRSLAGLGYEGVGYGLEVYAQDSTGTYLLSSSYAAFFIAQSSNLSWPVADYRRNLFVMQYGNASIVCDYE